MRPWSGSRWFRWCLFWCALGTCLGAAGGEKLEIKAHGMGTVDARSSVRVTCTVPRDADNRWLEIGIDGYTSHGVQLNGEQAYVTHAQLFENVGCVGPAYCRVTGNAGRQVQVIAPFLLVGCEQQP